jgi:DDE family transposase
MNAKQSKDQGRASSFLDSLRQFLTPAIWKQAEQARQAQRRSSRWSTQPLVLTLLAITWCCGDSQAERFETAKSFTAVCLAKRRRPGKHVQGFQQALARLPMAVLRIVAQGVRQRLLQLFDLVTDGFVVVGCDGSSMECPRTEELERRLDPALKKHAAPQVWVTAVVHLRTGLLWAWRLGKGYNRERSHLRALLTTLPAATLVVADAGYNGYELARAITTAGVSFLIRMSGKDRLYTERQVRLKRFKEGEVLLWPQDARRQGLPPLRVRLIRIRAAKHRDVWLLTNVLDKQRLLAAQAGRYYRWRWENEGLFRTFKRTLAKVKLTSRTLALIHREAEAALLATQLLLAQGVQGTASQSAAQRCSPRKVLLVIRAVILGRIGVRQRTAFHQRLVKALREDRQRTSSKVKRVWPRRFPHKPQKPPRFLMLSDAQKALAAKLLRVAA